MAGKNGGKLSFHLHFGLLPPPFPTRQKAAAILIIRLASLPQNGVLLMLGKGGEWEAKRKHNGKEKY